MGETIKMNWFKISKNFSERNHINERLKTLQELKDNLDYLKNFVFQSGVLAKNSNFKIISSKEITSFPTIHDILIEADEIALDSPWKFQSLCKEAIEHITKEINSLIKQREEFVFGKHEKTKKGLI